MQKLVWQNANGVELDLTSGNYGITEWEGFSNASLNIQSQQVPFQDGGVFLDALIEQRELSVTLAMQDNNNLELRYQQRRELISALNPKLGEGYLIYTNDFISERIKCVPQIPLFETHNSDTVGTPKASLTWTACSPYWEDLEETVVEITDKNGVLEIVNEGDVDVGFVMEIQTTNNETNSLDFRRQWTQEELTVQDFMNCRIDTRTGQKRVENEGYSAQKVEAYYCNNYTGTGSFVVDKSLYCEWANKYIATCTGQASLLYLSEDGIVWTETTTPSRDLSKAIIDNVNEQVITIDNNNISTLNSTLTQWTDTPNTNNYKAVYINTITNTVAFSLSDFAIMSKKTNVLFELGETVKFTLPDGNINEYAISILETSGTIKCLQDMYDGSFMVGVWYDLSIIIDIYGNVSKIPKMVWTEGIVDLYDTEGVYIGWGTMYMSQQTQIWICTNNLLEWEQIQNFGEIIKTITGNTIFTLEKTFLGVSYNKNIIGSTNGNLAICLKVGENNFVYQIAKDSTTVLKYRQKYIGV